MTGKNDGSVSVFGDCVWGQEGAGTDGFRAVAVVTEGRNQAGARARAEAPVAGSRRLGVARASASLGPRCCGHLEVREGSRGEKVTTTYSLHQQERRTPMFFLEGEVGTETDLDIDLWSEKYTERKTL